MSLKIKIVRDESNNRYIGKLFVDNEEINKARAPRPGCVARDLINYFALQYGMPEEVDLEIEEWK